MRLLLLTLVLSLLGTAALADCTSPAGPAGRIDYFPTENVFKYCDGTNWNFWAGQTVTGAAAPTGGGNVSAIDDLTDVDTAGKSNDDVLTWDGSIWGAAAPAAGGSGFGMQVFTSSGTWSKPAGVTKVLVIGVAGGAGGKSGASCSASPGPGAGAGGGGAFIKMVNVSAISSVSVTVGAGGNGGPFSNCSIHSNGQPGGTTSFGTHASASGGTSGAGGTGSNGDINISGEMPPGGQKGGASYFGGFANASTGNYGNGGWGGCTSCSGGAGTSGVLIVYEYY